MKLIPLCNLCALFLLIATPTRAQDARCTSEQMDRMQSVLPSEEVFRICGTSQTSTPARDQPSAEYNHEGEPIPRLNWGALEDYFDIGALAIGSNHYKPELEIRYNAIEFDVRATGKMGVLGRLMLPHWRACFYDRENIPMDSQKVQFEPLYVFSGWTGGMRGKGYISLPEKVRLSDVGVIRIKRLPCN